MKKLLAIALVFAMCVSFCACAKTITEDDLVGKWALSDGDYEISIQFTDKGTFGFAYVEYSGGNISEFESGNGEFEINGKKATLTFNGSNPFDSNEVKIKNDKLCIGDFELSKK